jgi:hypothetical protein
MCSGVSESTFVKSINAVSEGKIKNRLPTKKGKRYMGVYA